MHLLGGVIGPLLKGSGTHLVWMSHNKRIRVNAADKSQELVQGVLLHETYAPLIIHFLDTKKVLSDIIFVCKYFHWLIFQSSVGKSVCRQLIWNDYGDFVDRYPLEKSLVDDDNRVKFLKQIYDELDDLLESSSSKDWLPGTDGSMRALFVYICFSQKKTKK
ncbi:MAG: hypothetical protein GY714_14135 [Desulfobacterales bacterium]|nr:hypothetical protein [Desulfobacterales bacterium]